MNSYIHSKKTQPTTYNFPCPPKVYKNSEIRQ